MPQQPAQHQRTPDAADGRRSAVHRLLRPAVGAELGEVLRSRMGQAGRRSAERRARRPRSTGQKEMTMKKGLFAAVALALAVPALAHHSFAMFDQTKTITWTGVATQFVAQANHAELHFVPLGPDGKALRDKDGKPVSW